MFSDDKAWILDGGLATELENRGHDLSGALWSARLIKDDPAAIVDVHRAYLEAGADIIIAPTYQIGTREPVVWSDKWQDFVPSIRHGLDIAIAARDSFWKTEQKRTDSSKPLVAASIGPYGAILANGAEYTGDYDYTKLPPRTLDDSIQDHSPQAKLAGFHMLRWLLAMESDVDLLACETLPSFLEVQALLILMRKAAQKPVWFSFSCRDGERISDGTPIRECAKLLDGEPKVAAIGVNCTKPIFVESLIREIRSVSDKPIVVYPNSGEVWNGAENCWIEGGDETVAQFVERAVRWREAGATIIGGCCRTGPEHIARLRERFVGEGR